MGKYIDAEKLIAEIRQLRSGSCISESDDYYEIAKSEILDIVASLQQEEQDHLPDAGKMVEPEHIADVSKMMKDAVEVSGEVGYFNQLGLSIMLDKSCEKLGLEEGKKYSLIIKEME